MSTVSADRLIDVRELAALIHRSPSSIWRDAAAGLLPAPILVGKRGKRWRLSDVERWLRAGCPKPASEGDGECPTVA